METRILEIVLADWREDAQVLRKHGDEKLAEAIEKLCSDVADAAEDYITWLPESAARMRSNRSVEWLRKRFNEWRTQGHARMNGKVREYRQLVIPQHEHVSVVIEDGARSGRAAA